MPQAYPDQDQRRQANCESTQVDPTDRREGGTRDRRPATLPHGQQPPRARAATAPATNERTKGAYLSAPPAWLQKVLTSANGRPVVLNLKGTPADACPVLLPLRQLEQLITVNPPALGTITTEGA